MQMVHRVPVILVNFGVVRLVFKDAIKTVFLISVDRKVVIYLDEPVNLTNLELALLKVRISNFAV